MNWISTLLGNLNYGTILLLMLLESTVIPVPSELVVAPAAYHAASGQLNVVLVVLFATIGADLGASINYFAALYVGRPVIYKFANSKWGKMCLLNQEKVEKSERYFDNHGIMATLTGRLVPGIRHLISIPAGLARMNYWKFLLYTTIGAGVWHAILATMGWYLHTVVPENQLETTIQHYNHYIVGGILIIVALVVGYFVLKTIIKKKEL
ncbi:DedA family protein [Prevotella sp. E15-22]|uniref:DedA family protein n=1 Tax=Prevotella sp. E15-22 TaxID=2937774 RepID=UPI00205E1179|nr:DedA family protein [Prevotella sp. E15-22]UPS43530.1 DedA family protein [Prevotella sp. E15-22]